jgi:hypothetical protein
VYYRFFYDVLVVLVLRCILSVRCVFIGFLQSYSYGQHYGCCLISPLQHVTSKRKIPHNMKNNKQHVLEWILNEY